MLAPWKKSYDKPRQHTKKKTHDFANRGQSYGFSSSHVWMWELDHNEGWVLKNWCFWTVVLENTLESPLDSKEIKPVNPKGNQPWIFIGRAGAKTEAPIFGHLMQRANSLEKPLLLGKIEGGRRRGWQRMGSLDSIITNSISMSFSKFRETVRKREAYRAVVDGAAESQTRLSDWTELMPISQAVHSYYILGADNVFSSFTGSQIKRNLVPVWIIWRFSPLPEVDSEIWMRFRVLSWCRKGLRLKGDQTSQS